jgi:hypothetical protein
MIRMRLIGEGYPDAAQQLAAPTLRRTLTKLCLTAQNKSHPLPPRRLKRSREMT